MPSLDTLDPQIQCITKDIETLKKILGPDLGQDFAEHYNLVSRFQYNIAER